MRRLKLVMTASLVVIAAVALSGCELGIPIDVSGTWAGLITWAEGDRYAGLTTPISLFLVQERETVTGEVELMGPGSTPFTLLINSGHVRGNSISIAAAGTLTAISPPANVTITLSGDYDEPQLSGTGTQTIDGVPHDFYWQVQLTGVPPVS